MPPITIPLLLEQPARIELEEPASGQKGTLDLYELYAVVLQAKKAEEPRAVVRSFLSAFLSASFADNQIDELMESTEAAYSVVVSVRKKKVNDLRSSVTSTLHSPATL